jgi:hypothetical protein
VLTDYFRAADAATVVRALECDEGRPLVGGHEPHFEGMPAKRIDPDLVLGELVAAVRQVPWDVDLVGEAPVWPTTPVPGPDDVPDEDDPWTTGPWVVELDDEVRDVLAGVPEVELSAVVARWVRAEELHAWSADDMRPIAEELIGLARRARAAGERLYCLICL